METPIPPSLNDLGLVGVGTDSSLEVDLSKEIKEDSGQALASFDRKAVIDLCRDDLNFLAATIMPSQYAIAFPPLHQVAWNLLKEKLAQMELKERSPKQKFPQFALGWPRGFAKTTLAKLLVCLIVFFYARRFVLVVASNAQKAENILSDICDMLSEENVLSIFGNWKIHIERDTVNLKKFTFNGKTIILGALGSGGDPRGLNIKNERPDVILMDDMQSKENSDSPTQAAQLLSWMTSTLQKSKSPHGCLFLYVGNMFKSPGCILKLLKSNPNWTSMIVPGILSDGTSLWPELRSKEELIEELRQDIAMGTPEAFFAEVMNDDTANISSIFDISKVPKCPFADDIVAPASFIIIDVASDKINADDTTIIRYNVLDGIPVVENIISGVFSPGDTIKKSLVEALTHGVPLIAVEDVAYQTSLLYWFGQITDQHQIQGIHFVPVAPRGRPKNTRIISMLKRLLGTQDKDSKEYKGPSLYLREAVKPQVYWEINNFRPDKRNNTDNILDNLAYAEDVILEHSPLLWNPLAIENQAYAEAKVLEGSHAF